MDSVEFEYHNLPKKGEVHAKLVGLMICSKYLMKYSIPRTITLVDVLTVFLHMKYTERVKVFIYVYLVLY